MDLFTTRNLRVVFQILFWISFMCGVSWMFIARFSIQWFLWQSMLHAGTIILLIGMNVYLLIPRYFNPTRYRQYLYGVLLTLSALLVINSYLEIIILKTFIVHLPQPADFPRPPIPKPGWFIFSPRLFVEVVLFVAIIMTSTVLENIHTHKNLRQASHQKAGGTGVASFPTVNEDTPQEARFLLLKSDHMVHKVFLDEILYIKGMKEYVAFHLPDKRIITLQSLKNLEAQLPEDAFLRIHKSYIISINKVTARDGNSVQIGKEKLPIGGNYKEQTLTLLF